MNTAIDSLQAALADRYLIERELGHGGMATVYLARDLKHKRRVALKVLNPDLAASLGAARFLREIEITAGLTHPHILPLYDSGEAAGSLFYVLPFVEGESLRDRLTLTPQLPNADAVRITREVAAALDYAHRHGVVHRDVKPENILLHDGNALVADFGIARAVHEASSVEGATGATLTQTEFSLGTPAYMSPEQAAGERSVDGRSDIYSLACVSYEMLAGAPPFTGTSAEAIAKRFSGPPPGLSARRPDLPAGIDEVMGRALSLVAGDRYSTANDFAQGLASALASGGHNQRAEPAQYACGLPAPALLSRSRLRA